MTFEINRRNLLQLLAAGAAGGKLLAGSSIAFAQSADSVTIGWPSDVPSWDPNQRTVPDAQPIYKLVFNQPIGQNPKLELVPELLTKWELAADGRSMTVELRDDVTFHDGSKMTMADFRYTFLERKLAGHKLDIVNTWRNI
jgi:peptide/nickel transport system substrate-binding protein